MTFDLRPDPATKLDIDNIASAERLQVFMVDDGLWPTSDPEERFLFAVAGVWEWEHGIVFRVSGFFTREEYAFSFAKQMHVQVVPTVADNNVVQEIRNELRVKRLEDLDLGECYDA